MLPQKLQSARKQKGLTQEELAERAGVTARTIQRIESGETVPRAFTLKALAAALDLPEDSFIAQDLPPQKPAVGLKNNEVPSALPGADPGAVRYFLQLHLLSCFAYLVVPLVPFLVPYFFLKRRPGLPPKARELGRGTVKGQLCWSIAVGIALLGVAGWNIFRVSRGHREDAVNLVWPLLLLYAANAVWIGVRFLHLKRNGF